MTNSYQETVNKPVSPVERLVELLSRFKTVCNSGDYTVLRQIREDIRSAHKQIHNTLKDKKSYKDVVSEEDIIRIAKTTTDRNHNDIDICKVCGSSMTRIDGEDVCLVCGYNVERCVECGEITSRYYNNSTRKGYMCQKCKEERYEDCSCCNRRNILKKNMKDSPGGTRICPTCYRNRVSTCADCGAIKWTRDLLGISQSGNIKYVCRDCYNAYRRCNTCRDYFKVSEVTEIDGGYYCAKCVEEKSYLPMGRDISSSTPTINKPDVAVKPMIGSEVYEYLKNFYSKYRIKAMDNILIQDEEDTSIHFKIPFTDNETIAKDIEIMLGSIANLISIKTIGTTRSNSASRIFLQNIAEIDGNTEDQKNILREMYKICTSVFTEDHKYVIYQWNDKEIKLKIAKCIERFILLHKKYIATLSEEHKKKLEFVIKFSVNSQDVEVYIKEIQKLIEKFNAQKDLDCELTNNLTKKMEIAKYNEEFGSCQKSCNCSGLSIGFHDLFIDRDKLIIVIGNNMGRMVVRRMYNITAPDNVYYVVDRLYARGALANNKGNICNILIRQLSKALPENHYVVLQKNKRDDSSTIWSTVQQDIVDKCKPAVGRFETRIRPENRRHFYYRDSYTQTKFCEKGLFDTLEAEHCVVLSR